jgi:hypothetical protein
VECERTRGSSATGVNSRSMGTSASYTPTRMRTCWPGCTFCARQRCVSLRRDRGRW